MTSKILKFNCLILISLMSLAHVKMQELKPPLNESISVNATTTTTTPPTTTGIPTTTTTTTAIPTTNSTEIPTTTTTTTTAVPTITTNTTGIPTTNTTGIPTTNTTGIPTTNTTGIPTTNTTEIPTTNTTGIPTTNMTGIPTIGIPATNTTGIPSTTTTSTQPTNTTETTNTTATGSLTTTSSTTTPKTLLPVGLAKISHVHFAKVQLPTHISGQQAIHAKHAVLNIGSAGISIDKNPFNRMSEFMKSSKDGFNPNDFEKMLVEIKKDVQQTPELASKFDNIFKDCKTAADKKLAVEKFISELDKIKVN